MNQKEKAISQGNSLFERKRGGGDRSQTVYNNQLVIRFVKIV